MRPALTLLDVPIKAVEFAPSGVEPEIRRSALWCHADVNALFFHEDLVAERREAGDVEARMASKFFVTCREGDVRYAAHGRHYGLSF